MKRQLTLRIPGWTSQLCRERLCGYLRTGRFGPGRVRSWIQRTNPRLYRVYLLKEQLREAFRQPFEDAVVLLDRWLAWAIRSRLAPFVEVARMVLDQMEAIEAALYLNLSTPASRRSTPAYG